MELQFQPGTSSAVPRTLEAATTQEIDDEEPRIYSGYGAGGKFRKSRRGLKRSTPYDRPAPARHAAAGGLPASGSVTSSSSLASRLVGSASRLISSSLSYLFPSLFGRSTLSLPESTPGQDEEAKALEQDEEEQRGAFIDQDIQLAGKTATVQEQEERLGIAGLEQTGKREFDLARVEDMLKRKTWSRDQVSRLTELLSTRLTEDRPTTSHPAEASLLPRAVGASAGELAVRRDQENMSTPISEAQRWREERKRARTDCVPVEVAKAFMGDRTSIQPSFTQSFRATAHQLDRVAELQPPPGLGLSEDRYRFLPVLRSRTRSPAPQLAKKSPYLDEEWMSVGPVRRTRPKLFHINSSPYARALPVVEHAASRTYLSPPAQSRKTAQKILETLEVLTPVSTSKHISDDSTEAGSSGKFRGQGSQSMLQSETFKSSVGNLGASNGRLQFGSPMKFSISTIGAKKDLHSEDKSLVNRLLPNSEAGFYLTSTSLLSSSAAATSLPHSRSTFLSSTSGLITSTISEAKASFSLGLPPLKPESSKFSVPVKEPAVAFSQQISVTSMNALGNAEAASVREEHLGTDGLLLAGQEKEPKHGDGDQKEKLTNFQFRSSSVRFPFPLNAGTADSPLTEKGFPTAILQDGGSGTQPESQPLVTTTTTNTLTPGQSLFGSSSSSSPFFNVSGQLFGASSISKPSLITPLTLEASSAPFTFSPQPPSLVSCSTPSFFFSSSTVQNSVSFEAVSSSTEAPKSSPVFKFTSPSGGPELLVPATEGKALPIPSFSFGAGALPSPSSGTGLDSTVSFGSGSAPASTSTGQLSQTLDISDSISQPPFKFGGQSSSGPLFGVAQSSPFSFVENPQVSTGLATFSTGASGAEKAGRKFVKVKRRK